MLSSYKYQSYINKSPAILSFSKATDFYLRLLRLLLLIRCIGGLLFCFIFKAPDILAVYATVMGIVFVAHISKSRKYTPNIVYIVLAIDIIMMGILYYLKYNNIFLVIISTLSAAIFCNIWLLFLVYVFSTLSLFSNNLSKTEAILIYIILFFISSILHMLSKQQKQMYNTVAQQACQSALQQLTHMLMVKDITDGIILLSSTGQIISANTAALNIIGTDQSYKSNDSIEILHKESLDRIPKTILLEDRHAYAHLVPINNHIQNLNIQLAWLEWLKPFIHTNLVEDYLVQSLSGCSLIHIEREQKYVKESQKDKLASMGHMVAGVAHEIRNPLATIQQASDFLFEQIEQKAEIERLKTMINNNINRINQIISNLLNISKPPNDILSICLGKHIKQIVDDWQQRDQIRKNVISCYIPEKDVHTIFTPVHLQQIIENLLDNAIKFCSKQSASINLWLRHHPQYNTLIELWVLNDGPIIDNTDQVRLFEPFFTKSAPTHSTHGVGLGLHIVRVLCMQNKATIEYARNIDIPVNAQYGFVIRFKKDG
jgi:two-component system sensor histidine kinase PilS (NtrC family)